jgi:PII-like signaling protein
MALHFETMKDCVISGAILLRGIEGHEFDHRKKIRRTECIDIPFPMIVVSSVKSPTYEIYRQ